MNRDSMATLLAGDIFRAEYEHLCREFESTRNRMTVYPRSVDVKTVSHRAYALADALIEFGVNSSPTLTILEITEDGRIIVDDDGVTIEYAVASTNPYADDLSRPLIYPEDEDEETHG